MCILDGLHLKSHWQSPPSATSADLSATKFSLQVSKINVSFLQAGLAESHVQLTELRTPVDIVTMSLFALSCQQIQMETILSNRQQSTSGIVKIQSITGQFRRLSNQFSSIDRVHLHAIDARRCRLQIQLPRDIPMHLSIEHQQDSIGFVMNEFGVQRVCFKLINNAAKEQRRSPATLSNVPIDETLTTTKGTTKTKTKKKPLTDVSRQ
jgi:hypothetical protein